MPNRRTIHKDTKLIILCEIREKVDTFRLFSSNIKLINKSLGESFLNIYLFPFPIDFFSIHHRFSFHLLFYSDDRFEKLNKALYHILVNFFVCLFVLLFYHLKNFYSSCLWDYWKTVFVVVVVVSFSWSHRKDIYRLKKTKTSNIKCNFEKP